MRTITKKELKKLGVILTFRIPKDKLEGNFQYDIRHHSERWDRPVMLERDPVCCNYFGTLVTSKPINFGKSDCIEIKSR